MLIFYCKLCGEDQCVRQGGDDDVECAGGLTQHFRKVYNLYLHPARFSSPLFPPLSSHLPSLLVEIAWDSSQLLCSLEDLGIPLSLSLLNPITRFLHLFPLLWILLQRDCSLILPLLISSLGEILCSSGVGAVIEHVLPAIASLGISLSSHLPSFFFLSLWWQRCLYRQLISYPSSLRSLFLVLPLLSSIFGEASCFLINCF